MSPRVMIPRQKERKTVHVGAFIPREQHYQLYARAREEDRSVSAVLRRAIDGYLAKDAPTSLADVLAEAAELQQQAMSKGSP
jgi:hypothetical protein